MRVRNSGTTIPETFFTFGSETRSGFCFVVCVEHRSEALSLYSDLCLRIRNWLDEFVVSSMLERELKLCVVGNGFSHLFEELLRMSSVNSLLWRRKWWIVVVMVV
jgi:hypothetical protein